MSISKAPERPRSYRIQMALARSEGNGQRSYSMLVQIRRERDDYYTMLERSQKAALDVTAWQERFLLGSQCYWRR